MNRRKKERGVEPAKPDAEKPSPTKRSFPCQPPGEDFFLAEVQLDTPDDPCWDAGYMVVGSWQTIERTISACLAFGRKGRLRIYQGEVARRRLVADLQEELRFQQQKRAIPNN
jgi:hypothetical protein